jgi:hypothetical protein
MASWGLCLESGIIPNLVSYSYPSHSDTQILLIETVGQKMSLFLSLFLIAHVLIYVFRGKFARSFVRLYNRNVERMKFWVDGFSPREPQVVSLTNA